MPKSKSYHEDLIQSLKDLSEAAMYIEVTIEEGEVEMLRKALKNVVESHEKMNNLSEKAKLIYEKFDRMLSERKGEEIYCLSALLEALGFHLSVTDSKASNN